jgi:hypothetical protein
MPTIIPRKESRSAYVRGSEGDPTRKAALAAVVEMVRVLDAGLPPLGVTAGGAKVHIASKGSPLQVKLTCELNPPTGITVKVAVPLCPVAIVSEEGFTENW